VIAYGDEMFLREDGAVFHSRECGGAHAGVTMPVDVLPKLASSTL
jgi:hypothetical protein